MAGMGPHAPTPTLTRARPGGGWRLPLVAMVAVVVALVGFTRLGGSDPLPSPFAPTPAPTRPTAGQTAGPMPRSPDGLTYADGIPTHISTRPVHRVRGALLGPLGQMLLVGGWYHQPHCRSAGRPRAACTAGTMSDVPLVEGQGDVRTSFIALDSQLGEVGAYVVQAIVVDDPLCSIRDLGDCQPRLLVLAQVWSGAGQESLTGS